MPVPIAQVDRVHLELFSFAIERNVDDQIATTEELAGNKGLGLAGSGKIRADVENETVLLARPDKHGHIDSGRVQSRGINVHNSQ